MTQARTVARLIAALALLSCGDSTGPREPAAIIINPNNPSVGQGLQLQLTGTVVDIRGRPVRGRQPIFSTSDAAVATVTPLGLVTSVGPMAPVAITAEYNGITHSVNLAVTRRVVALSVTPNPLVINRNAQKGLLVTALDFVGGPVYSQVVTLTSLDPAVVTVNTIGVVTAGANLGNTEIVVTGAGLTVRVPVTVAVIPTTIDVQPLNVVLPPGGSRQITATVKDGVGEVIAGATATFTGTAPEAFSVSPTGFVAAVASSGSGTLRVSYDNLVTLVGVFIGIGPVGTLTASTPLVGAPYGAAVGPEGQVVVSQVAASGAARGTLPGNTFPARVATGSTPLGVAINPAGTRAYVARLDGIAVIDLATNLPLAPVTGLNGQVYDVGVSPDGQVVYGAAGSQVYRIDAASHAVVDSTPGLTATWLVVDPTLPRVFVTYLSPSVVVELDATTLAEVRRFNVGLGGRVQGLALRPGGAELFVAVELPWKLQVWDLTTGTLTQEVPLAGGPFGVVMAQEFIVVTEPEAGAVELLDVATRVSRARLQVGGAPRRLAANHSGTVVVVPNEAGWVDFIE